MADSEKPDGLQYAGGIVFFATCLATALEQGGFGFGLALGVPVYSVVAAVGGGIGGWLIARTHRGFGLVAGAVAGPLGFLALQWYASLRNAISSVEVFVIAMIASVVPGLAIYCTLVVFAKKRDRVRIDDAGVSCTDPKGAVKRLLWDELQSIQVEASGPPWIGATFVLSNGAEKLTVPDDAIGIWPLYDRLKALPGFDLKAAEDGRCSIEKASFLCWTRVDFD